MNRRIVYLLGLLSTGALLSNTTVLAATAVDDCSQLQGINLALGDDYELSADINCNGFTFEPIGTYGNGFSGTFDGNGHTISNVSMSGHSPGGLFGLIDGGTVENLHLANFSISGFMEVGALAGVAYDATIRNVSADNFTILGDMSAGGLFGETNNTTLERSYTTNGFVEIDIRYGGGIVGRWTGGNMSDVYSRDSSITTPVFGEMLGGIAGYTSAGSSMILANLYSNNTVNADFSGGGLIGSMGSGPTTCLVRDSFFAGSVAGSAEIGQIVGYLSGACAVENVVSLSTPCIGADASSGGTDCSQAGDESDFYSRLNAPLSSWDFGAVWLETAGFPLLFWTDVSFPGTPTNALAVSSDTSVALSWTNPDNAAFASITIRRSTSDYPSSPTEGVAVATGLTGTSFNDTNLTPGVRYYYSIFARNADGDYGAPATTMEIVGRNACLLEAYWKFDANPSTPADATGNGYNATGTNVTLSEDVPTTGFLNPYSFAFNGTDSRVDANRPVADDFTICAWIKTTAQGAGTGTQHYLSRAIAHAETGGAANDFGLGMDANERLTFGNGNGSSDFGVHGATAINTGEWTHVCATRQKDTGAIKLYVDGAQDGSGTGSLTSLTSNAVLTIGYGTDGAQRWDGLIDDVRVYNYELYPDEIAEIADGIDACFGAATPRASSSSSEERQQGSGGTRGKDGNKKIVEMLMSRSSASASSSSRSSATHAAAMNSPLQERTCSRVAKRFSTDQSALERLNARLQKRFGFSCAG